MPEEEGLSADDVDAAFAPAPRPDVVGIELDGETVLVEGERLQVLHLDRIGTIVWNCFDGEATIEELVVDLADAFDADPDVVREDVLNLTRQLGRSGLLAGVAAEVPSFDAAFSQPTGLPIGTEWPEFRLPLLGGGDLGSDDLRGRRVMLVNWSPACGFCVSIADQLAELAPQMRDQGVDLMLLAHGDAGANQALLAAHGLDVPALLASAAPADADDPFAGLGTPVAYVLDAEGRIAEPLQFGAVEVPNMARQLAGLEPAESAGSAESAE